MIILYSSSMYVNRIFIPISIYIFVTLMLPKRESSTFEFSNEKLFLC